MLTYADIAQFKNVSLSLCFLSFSEEGDEVPGSGNTSTPPVVTPDHTTSKRSSEEVCALVICDTCNTVLLAVIEMGKPLIALI